MYWYDGQLYFPQQDELRVIALIVTIFLIALLALRFFFHLPIGGALVLLIGGFITYVVWNIFRQYNFGIFVPLFTLALTVTLFIRVTH
jgi:hypothetical protein